MIPGRKGDPVALGHAVMGDRGGAVDRACWRVYDQRIGGGREIYENDAVSAVNTRLADDVAFVGGRTPVRADRRDEVVPPADYRGNIVVDGDAERHTALRNPFTKDRRHPASNGVG